VNLSIPSMIQYCSKNLNHSPQVLILTRLVLMTTFICYDNFQHVKMIVIKFIFKTVKICSDVFHNENTVAINFILEMTSLILVQIIIEKKCCERIAQYNL
jgi:hypothetical protein